MQDAAEETDRLEEKDRNQRKGKSNDRMISSKTKKCEVYVSQKLKNHC